MPMQAWTVTPFMSSPTTGRRNVSMFSRFGDML